MWEEIIINCPKHIKLLAMSATVANSQELGAWISQVHQQCDNVTTTFRPVPLKWWFAWAGDEAEATTSYLTPLLREPDLDEENPAVCINPRLETSDREYEEKLRTLERFERRVKGRSWEDMADTFREMARLEQELASLDEVWNIAPVFKIKQIVVWI